MPRILEPSLEALGEATRRLRRGELVAFPTETVYGLGADTFNPDAVERIYALKGRPGDNPLIAHALDEDQAACVVDRWDDRCARLSHAFWPGPLTLVLAKSARVPGAATAGLATIAVRAPAHETTRRLLGRFGQPISAPSANRSGRLSPTAAAHVAEEFPEADDLIILDGGPCAVGLESTVLDLTGDVARVLRPGCVTVAMLRELLPEVECPPQRRQGAAPGTSPQHYAPRAPVELVDPSDLAPILEHAAGDQVILCFAAPAEGSAERVLVMPRSAAAYAAHLYEALRRADALKPERILIERPAETEGVWAAIQDRLERAAARA